MNLESARAMAQPWSAAGPRLPILVSWTIIVALLAQESLSNVGAGSSGWAGREVLGTIVAICTSFLYVVWQLRIARGAAVSEFRPLVVLLVTGAGAALLIDGQWAPLPLALSAVMLVLSPARATAAVAAILVGLVAYLRPTHPRLVVVMPVAVLAMATVLYAFNRLAIVIRELQLAREELARTRVDQERMRMQRDLHDMLGRTLVAASLRNQVALRTLYSDPRATREHLEQVHAVLTDGQVRLRAVTSGPVIVSLADEIESATSLCHRLGIEIIVEVDGLPSGAPDREVGAIVRESVTNMLKHSNALHCWVTIRTDPEAVTVTVVNDGCLVDDVEGRTNGTGLTHLRDLAEGMGGTFAAEFFGNHRFRISAQLTHPPTSSAVQGIAHSQDVG